MPLVATIGRSQVRFRPWLTKRPWLRLHHCCQVQMPSVRPLPWSSQSLWQSYRSWSGILWDCSMASRHWTILEPSGTVLELTDSESPLWCGRSRSPPADLHCHTTPCSTEGPGAAEATSVRTEPMDPLCSSTCCSSQVQNLLFILQTVIRLLPCYATAGTAFF